MKKVNIFFRLIIIMTLLIICSNELFSTNYYVSLSGNDNNNGWTPSTAWKSISKVNMVMNSFAPGDRIFFNKGDVFEGGLVVTSSGTAGNEIIFDSYGAGVNPKITGVKKITDWSVYSGSIYVANITDTVSNLYVNGSLMTIARFPDSGWLRVDIPNGNNGFYDASLTQGGSYWNGANCRIRTTDWCYETKPVLTFSSGNIVFSSLSQYSINADYGYYLDNKLNLLTVENEWYYNNVSHKIYLYAPGGINPINMDVEGVVYKYGFYITSSNLIIQNLTIEGYKDINIDVTNCDNIKVKGCNINKSDKMGIVMYGNNHTLDNNIFQDNLNTGIVAYIFNGSIINNSINRTGLKPGYGENGWGYIGVSIESSTGTLLKNNSIDSSGYTGIRASGNNIIENNYVDYSCLILNDGGALAFDNADGLNVLNNIFTNTISDKTSCPPGKRFN